MTDPGGWPIDWWRHAQLADILALYYGTHPPVQCAPAVGVHQGCQHAEQSPAEGGTCTRNSRVSGRCDVDCCATGAAAGRAELVPSTVAPTVDVSNPYAGRSLAELEAVMQSEEYLRPAPATGSHTTSDH